MANDIDLHMLTRTMTRIAELLTDLEGNAGLVSDIHESVGTFIDSYLIANSAEAIQNQFIRDAAIELYSRKNMTEDMAWKKAEKLWAKAPKYVRSVSATANDLVCDVTHSRAGAM